LAFRAAAFALFADLRAASAAAFFACDSLTAA
jgi:hypothetical protein